MVKRDGVWKQGWSMTDLSYQFDHDCDLSPAEKAKLNAFLNLHESPHDRQRAWNEVGMRRRRMPE